MATKTSKTEPGAESKLYGKLPAISYDVYSCEKTGDEKLGEVLEVFGGNAEAVADAALKSFNDSQRDSAGGAFWKLLKHARNLIKGGSVPNVSIETVKNEKGDEVVSPKTASVIQALASSMAAQIASLNK